jgi:phospholipid/cholesterol/gamma-HCH transport system permease protein
MTTVRYSGNSILFEGELQKDDINRLFVEINSVLKRFTGNEVIIDLSGVEEIDTSGVVFLDAISEHAEKIGISCSIINARQSVEEVISTFSSKRIEESFEKEGSEKILIFERIGDRLVRLGQDAGIFFQLLSDTFYYAVSGLFHKKGMRRGEFINQCILIGMNALPIVALISFLIGFILALQSAAQLRQFGAAIYVADLVAISMTREMGPIMTAVVLAGRSGSAIASEIATMVVTEETDALKSMALNPVQYVLVPKVYAILVTAPMLTMLSIMIGIFGSLVIGITYLDVALEPFYNQVVNALYLKDVVTGLVKSVVFACIIVMVGAAYGFRVKGGAEDVGRVTTASVVASIFLVILADSLLGLIFYFGQGVQF